MDREIRLGAVTLVALLLLPGQAAATHSASWDEHGLNYYFATTGDTFAMYEDVPMVYIVSNTTEDTLIIEHPCSGLGGISFIVWSPASGSRPDGGVVWGCCGCFDEDWIDAMEPGETYVRDVDWPMWDMYEEALITEAGTYTLEGEFRAFFFPGHEFIGHAFTLEVGILYPPAATAFELEASWAAIKALYR
jgi:hypothetical protein